MFFIARVLRSLSLVRRKTEGQTVKTENLTGNYQTQIKILANPGLA